MKEVTEKSESRASEKARRKKRQKEARERSEGQKASVQSRRCSQDIADLLTRISAKFGGTRREEFFQLVFPSGRSVTRRIASHLCRVPSTPRAVLRLGSVAHSTSLLA